MTGRNHRRRQPYSRGSTCCPIICAGPAPNVKCCPIFGIGLNINSHELVNYRSIIETVATKCQILRLQCTKFDFGWGSAPEPAEEAYSAPLDPIAAFKRAYFWGEWGKGKERDGKRREGRRRKGREREGTEGMVKTCCPIPNKLSPPMDEILI